MERTSPPHPQIPASSLELPSHPTFIISSSRLLSSSTLFAFVFPSHSLPCYLSLVFPPSVLSLSANSSINRYLILIASQSRFCRAIELSNWLCQTLSTPKNNSFLVDHQFTFISHGTLFFPPQSSSVSRGFATENRIG